MPTVQGDTSISSENGVAGRNDATTVAADPLSGHGVFGTTQVPDAAAVAGAHLGPGAGVSATSATGHGVVGRTDVSASAGVYGENGGKKASFKDEAWGAGVLGVTTVGEGSGVVGRALTFGNGVHGRGATGVLAVGGFGVEAEGNTAVSAEGADLGLTVNGTIRGVLCSGGMSVQRLDDKPALNVKGQKAGIQIDAPFGVLALSDTVGVASFAPLAGYFGGMVLALGTIFKAGGGFRIDHPQDPENRYLNHSFVESDEMLNVYSGNVHLDRNGEADVALPAWFEAVNQDFRYQLTCIGGFAQVYIAEGVANNRFRIAGGRPRLQVSWQVTGVRKDAWAQKHRIRAEEQKTGAEKGRYLHPAEHGKPESQSMRPLYVDEGAPAEDERLFAKARAELAERRRRAQGE